MKPSFSISSCRLVINGLVGASVIAKGIFVVRARPPAERSYLVSTACRYSAERPLEATQTACFVSG